jgi:hypothetical protein
VTAVVYLPFLGGGWVSDDFPHLAHWQQQRAWQVLTTPDKWGYFRPVPHATLVANLITSGSVPWIFRATNLALHLAVVIAAFLVARQLLARTESALLATLAFPCTPEGAPDRRVLGVRAAGTVPRPVLAARGRRVDPLES